MDLDRVNELGFEKTPKWHSVILVVAFNKWWNIFIGIQCFGIFLVSTYTLALRVRDGFLITFRYITDVIYAFEIVCMITYHLSPKIRKMKYVKTRLWFTIVIDIISVFPFELIYFCHGIRANLDFSVQLWLVQNRVLRIYRIFLMEYYYDIYARKSGQYAVLMVFGFTFRLLIISHLLCCLWIIVEDTVGCNPEEAKCFVWCECHMIDLVLLNWSGKKYTLFDPWERVITSLAMLLGFLLIFTYFYPKIFYFSMLLFYEKALYNKELEKLQAFFTYMVLDRNLKSEILHRFTDVQSKGRIEFDIEKLLENIPLAMRKDISTDIYWEAFRHSDLFSEVSRNCKRSLSLLMKTENYRSGDVIYNERQDKMKMMFLFKGVVHIMAEENHQSPLLSFSNGTILGEVCLFYLLRSRAILKCHTQTEIHVLTMRDALSVLKDYPKDKKLVFYNLCERLKIAKYTQWRKEKFGHKEKMELFAQQKSTAVDCVKWVKRQWMAILDAHKQYFQLTEAKKQDFQFHSLRDNSEIKIKIDYVSNYLDLIVLSEFLEVKKDTVCFRTSFPWSINPSCQFLSIWYYVVIVTSVIPALLYPLCTAWTQKFPRSVYQLSFVVTLVFIADVFLKLFTAIKTKHSIITEFHVVLRYLFQKPTFYVDLLAAFPYQIIVLGKDINTVESYVIGLPLHPAILKSYVFIFLKVPLGNYFHKIIIFKNFLIYFLMLYWTAELVQLLAVRDVIATEHEWFDKFFGQRNKHEKLDRYFVSVISAMVIALSIPEYLMSTTDLAITVSCTIMKYLFFLYLGYFISELFGAKTLQIYGPGSFHILIKRISKFFDSVYISPQRRERLLKNLRFQWEYDKADYLSSKVSIISTIPPHLRRQVYSQTTYKTLRLCPIFQDESLDFIADVMDKSYVVPVPRGSVVVTFGHTCHFMSILHQGYCQMDSYLLDDVHSKLSQPIKVSRGEIFPVLSCLYCIPSPVSVATTTDCEVIMIQLNDLLNVMLKHNIFKDMTETLLELNFEKCLRNVEPGLLKVNICNRPVNMRKAAFRKALTRKGFCWKLLFCFCPSKNFFKGKFFKYWIFFYVLYLTGVCWLWPCCFGLFLKSSHILIPILISTKVISFINLVLRFYFPYYNKKGLLVSHPVFTSLHYLTSGFIADLLIAVPMYAIYLYGINGSRTQPHYLAVLLLFVRLFFMMNYIMGFLNSLFWNRYFTGMLKIVLGLALTFNMLVNFTMYYYTKWTFGCPYRVVSFEPLPYRYPTNSSLLTHNSCKDYYVFTAYWVLSCLMTTDYLLHELSGHQLFYSYMLAFIGIFGSFFFYVWVASSFIFANIQGTIFQEKVFSLMSYLKYEKADDALIDYVKSYCSYEWSQTHGEDLKKLCKQLPLYLQEELVYPIYRPTFYRNQIFTGADEGFFKILATKVTSLFFNRGSLIIFQNEVQSNIFFVHKGKCFVYDWFLVLDNGSIVGDIHQTGVMQNTVYALTHVHMLTITSDEFFRILNSFYTLEANFLYWVKTAETFVKSNFRRTGQQLRPVDNKDILKAFCLKTKTLRFEDESVFEDPDNSSIKILKNIQFSRRRKIRLWTIYPGTWKIRAYTTLRLSVTLVTFFSFPIFTSFGGLTITAFTVFGVTDFFWLICIILTFQVGIIDRQKGDVITDFKLIARDYATRFNGLVVDLLALIPFEVIPVALGKGIKSANGQHVAWARIFRLIRGHCFYQFLKSETEQFNNNIYVKYFFMISFVIVVLFHSVAIYITLATEPSIVAARNHHVLKMEQFFAFVFAFEYVINFVSSTNLCVIAPNTRSQLHFFNLNIILYLLLKSILISRMLSTLFVRWVATAYCKFQMGDLESYLTDNDASPSIIREVLNYIMNLLQLSRSENMPSLLKDAPPSIRAMVMRNIYIKHLITCPLFKGISRRFLNQLIARATRELYFPGQVIVEQGDVDRRMYFIHSGEVYVITETQDRAYIESVKRIIEAGACFGEAQGLWLSIPHCYTYRARTVVDMLVIHSDDWTDLRRSFPDIAKEICENAKCLNLI